MGIYKVVGSRLTKGWREGLINHDVLGNLGWGGWAGPTGQAPGSQFEEKAICFPLYKPAVMKRNVQTMRVVTQGWISAMIKRRGHFGRDETQGANQLW